MSRQKRRGRRRARSDMPSASGVSSATIERVARPLPEWRWRTFPVYFAFALGAFIGLYLGILAAAGPAWLGTAVFVTVAIMLGLGLSRLTTHWLVTRNWMQRRAKAKTKAGTR